MTQMCDSKLANLELCWYSQALLGGSICAQSSATPEEGGGCKANATGAESSAARGEGHAVHRKGSFSQAQSGTARALDASRGPLQSHAFFHVQASLSCSP